VSLVVFLKESVKTRDEKSVFFLEERREDERFFLRNFSIEKIESLFPKGKK